VVKDILAFTSLLFRETEVSQTIGGMGRRHHAAVTPEFRAVPVREAFERYLVTPATAYRRVVD
jgi:hypothetical protein